MTKDQERALSASLAAVRKIGGRDSAVILSQTGARSEVSEVIPSGISALDYHVIGVGGLPLGRTSEWSGPEGAGKTAIAYTFGASVQQQGGIFVYGDAENSYSEERAQVYGVDPELTMLVQRDTLEEYGPAMIAAVAALDGKVPALVAYDSIAGSTTEAEMAGDYSGDAMGRRAGTIGKMVRGMAALAASRRAHVMLVNQIRKKVGVVFGDPIYTPGGDAPRYTSSLRVRMYPGGKVERGEERVGQRPTFTAVKNRHAVPQHKCESMLLFASGWDEVWSLVNYAKDLKLVPEDAQPTREVYEEVRAKLGWPASHLMPELPEGA